MNWSDLFQMQKKLDAYISKKHGLDEEDLFEEKFLALLVELGELANETRCFKFWSKKEGSEAGVILEEYVDNIHFILSLGLEKNFCFSRIDSLAVNKSPTNQFNEVFLKAIGFYQAQTEEAYLQMVQSYLQLAQVLGFSEEAIVAAYLEKNKVNYERQEAGY